MSNLPQIDLEAVGSPALDSRRLQMFVISASGGSFAAAASHLNLCPSAVSHAIKGLEDELGCVLFRRAGPRVALTRAGVRLLPLARESLLKMESLRHEARLMDARAEPLRLVIPESVCSGLLPAALADFYECFPSVSLELVTEPDLSAAVESARQRRVDLVLTAGEGPDDFVKRRLYGETLNLYSAPFFPLAQLEEVTAPDLKRYRMLTADAPAADVITNRLFAGISPLARQIWQLASTQSVVEMARVGLGVALLSGGDAAAAVAAGHLRILTFRGIRLDRTFCACWPATHPPSWAAEVFLALLATAGESRQEA